MSSRTLRALALASAAVLTVSALTACGGNDTSGTGGDAKAIRLGPEELLVIVPGALSIGVRMQQARDLTEASLVICYIIVVLTIGILVDLLFNAADGALRKRWGLTS